MAKHKIIFFGTPKFALPALEALIKADFNICLVVTQPPAPAGRGKALKESPVNILAREKGLIISYNVSKNDLRAELGIVVSFGKILPQKVLDSFPLGCLNIHPSLLPKYRGSSPIQAALLNGDKLTGISIIKLDKNMDHGPILAAKEVFISNQDTSESLETKMAEEAAALLINALNDYLAGKYHLIPQNDDLAVYTNKISKEAGQINFKSKKIAIERMIRAFYPWPGAYALFKNDKSALRLKIIKAELPDPEIEKKLPLKNPGNLQIYGNDLYVQCVDGFLKILELQPENRKSMKSGEFISGYKKIILD